MIHVGRAAPESPSPGSGVRPKAPSWEVALVTLLLVHASGETFVVAPAA